MAPVRVKVCTYYTKSAPVDLRLALAISPNSGMCLITLQPESLGPTLLDVGVDTIDAGRLLRRRPYGIEKVSVECR